MRIDARISFFHCTYYGVIYFGVWAAHSLSPSLAVFSSVSSLLGSVHEGYGSEIGIWARNRQHGYPPLLKVHQPYISLSYGRSRTNAVTSERKQYK
jgi:hypothetical protein